MKKHISIALLVLLVVIGGVVWYDMHSARQALAPVQDVPQQIKSFAECVDAGYPVMESYPRQCRTPDGRTYAEEIQQRGVYANASSSDIRVELPFPGAVVGKTFTAKGVARGGWYFEGSFPVVFNDSTGTEIAHGVAKAKGEWMTDAFVPFEASIAVPESYIGTGTLVFKRDNPSGLPQNDASYSFEITVEY